MKNFSKVLLIILFFVPIYNICSSALPADTTDQKKSKTENSGKSLKSTDNKTDTSKNDNSKKDTSNNKHFEVEPSKNTTTTTTEVSDNNHSNVEDSEKTLVMKWLPLGLAIIALIITMFLFFKINKLDEKIGGSWKKINDLNDKINQVANPNKNSLLNSQSSEINETLTKVKFDLKEAKDKIEAQSDKIDDLIIKFDATKSINRSIEENTKSQMKEVDRIIENQVEEDKGQFFNVEYFVESGLIKFRQTNTSTPFYIQKFKDKSLLTINETVYASTYSESIEKCFKVRGRMTGQYRNIIPGNCKYDEFTKTWKLESTGEIESI